jgi:serine/threonine protein kinase/tetratricopeptide (TPR) repeat protein
MVACPSCSEACAPEARFCPKCGNALPVKDPNADPYIGQLQQNYRILSVVGVGGMGKVYRAEQVKLKRTVCIKTLLPHLANDPSLVKRFELEGFATASIRHPNIVQVLDFGQFDDRTLYIAMEYVEGKSLRNVLSEEAPVTAARAVTIVQQMLSGLAEAHANNIVHRDLKPGNVLMSKLRDGTDLVKLVDFGIAKVVGGEVDGQPLTRTGMMVGTPGYMAPEQMMGENVDGTADIYSVGVILWELLTGQKLFGRVDESELARRHLMMPAPSPSSVSRLPVSEQLDEVVLRALEKKPERRYATAMDFSRALDAVEVSGRSRTGQSNTGLPAVPANVGNPPTSGSGLNPAFVPNVGSGLNPAYVPGAQGPATGANPLTNLRGAVPDKLLNYAASLATMVGERRTLSVAYCEVSSPRGGDPSEAGVMRQALGAVLQSLQDFAFSLGGASMRLPGNALALVFGVAGEEDSGIGAVTRFALGAVARVGEASKALPRPLQFRAGLHSGIVEDAVFAERAFESNGVEELLSTARHVESLSQPGRPLATRAIQKRTEETIVWVAREGDAGDDVGPVFEATEPRQRRGALEPMIGRAQEVEYCARLVAQLTENRPGGFVFVGGPGVGKTRMLDAAEELAQAREVIVARARGGRFGVATPLDVVRQFVLSLSAPGERDPNENTRTTLAGLERLQVTRSDIERLETMLGAGGGGGAVATGATADEHQSLDRAVLLDLFRSVARQKGLLLLLDDLHTADRQSLELLSEVLARSQGLGLGIVATARAGSSEALKQLKRFELGPLSRAELEALVAARLSGGTVAPALVELVVERSDGNPLFAREVLMTLVESGAARLVGGEWQLQGTLEELPDSLSSLMNARIDRLSPQARLLLRYGAVAGRTFPIALITAAVDSPLDVFAAINECVTRGVLSAAPNQRDAYYFNQALLQDAMVARISAVDRKAIHLSLAEAIERGASAGAENQLEAMARHFRGAEQPRKAVKYLKLAGDTLLERRAWGPAAEAYRHCLSMVTQGLGPQGVTTEAVAQSLLELVKLAATALMQVAPADVPPMVEAALVQVPDNKALQARAEVLRQRALAYTRLTRLTEAEADLTKATSLVPALAAPQLAGALRADLASVLEARGDLAAASKLLIEGLSFLSNRKLDDKNVLWQFLNQLGRIHVRLGKLSEAGEFFDSARVQAKAAQSMLGESRVVSNMAVLAANRKDVAQSLAMFDESRQLAEDAGDRLGVLRARYNRGRLLLATRADEAKVELRVVVDEARAIGWREGEAMALQALGANR